MKKVLLLLVIVLVGCTAEQYTADDVVQVFEDENLEIEDVESLTEDEYNMEGIGEDMYAMDGARFSIPSHETHARILIFDDKDKLEKRLDFNDRIKESVNVGTWDIVHGNILIEMDKELPEEQFEKYKAAIKALN